MIENLSFYTIPGLKDFGDLPERRRRNGGQLSVGKPILAEDFLYAVSEYLNIPTLTIKKRQRKKDIVYARKLCVYLIRTYTLLSLNDICIIFGEALTDHTSVMHCEKFIQKQISGNYPNKEIMHDIEAITQIAKGIQTIKYHKNDNLKSAI